MRKALLWLGLALATTVLTLFFVAFGLLQMQPGKALTAAAIARVASSPDSEWAIDGLGGTVPFG